MFTGLFAQNTLGKMPMIRSTPVVGCLLNVAGTVHAAPEKVAVLDLQFSNLSPVPTDTGHVERRAA